MQEKTKVVLKSEINPVDDLYNFFMDTGNLLYVIIHPIQNTPIGRQTTGSFAGRYFNL